MSRGSIRAHSLAQSKAIKLLTVHTRISALALKLEHRQMFHLNTVCCTGICFLKMWPLTGIFKYPFLGIVFHPPPVLPPCANELFFFLIKKKKVLNRNQERRRFHVCLLYFCSIQGSKIYSLIPLFNVTLTVCDICLLETEQVNCIPGYGD